MPARLIDGKKIAEKYLAETKDYISKNKITPRLATILAGNDPASINYVNIKKKTCESLGINVQVHKNGGESSIINLIDRFNSDRSVNGILVQLPLPSEINTQKIIEHVDPLKDVDGIHPSNMGRLAYGDESMPACTAFGIIKMLEHENVKISGSSVVIIGRGIHVGKPLYSLLYNRDATVTMCHTKTRNSEKITKEADMVVVAVGKPNYLSADMIKEGAVVIDVGVNKIGEKLVGDADLSVRNKASLVTPVPGGVGPMTIAMLARNTLHAYIRQNPGPEN